MAKAAMSPRQRVGVAVARITDPGTGYAPYFGAMLRGFVRREMSAEMEAAMNAVGLMPSMAVSADGILFWSPTFVMERSIGELAFVLMHETMHVVLKHFSRAKALGVTPERQALANMAQDACINEELRKGWPHLGKEGIYPESLGQPLGLVFEERYRRLLQERAKQDGGAADGGGEGGADKKQGDGPGRGWCGSCANHPVPGEAPPGSSRDARSEAEMERFRRETAHAVKAQSNKGRGIVPDSLNRWADQMLAPPVVDWRTKLARSVRAAVSYRPGAVDFAWTKVSRRQAGIGYGPGRPIVPGFRAPVPRVACIVDTSGSMGEVELTAAASELQGVLGAVGADVTVCTVDAAVHDLQQVSSIQAACALMKGGGGTSMTPGFEALAKHQPRSEVVIVLTDGEIGDGYPAVEPAWCKTIWCVVGSYAGDPCPWGETIHIEEQHAQEAA